MNELFYVSAAVALIATSLVITGKNVVHALLYLVVSLLAVAMVFVTLGAAFVAALEVIVYAGAIMVLFVFIIMMLDLGRRGYDEERRLLDPRFWTGPAVLAAVLLVEFFYLLAGSLGVVTFIRVGPAEVGIALFGRYLLGVEMASLLLMAGLVGAFHIGRRGREGRRPI